MDGGALVAHFRHATAEDVRGLAFLQDREISAEVLTQLKEIQFPDSLGLRLQSEQSKQACDLLRKGLAEIAVPIEEAVLNDLAADFAGIYLNNRYHVTPYESPWCTDEGLMRQAPMIQVRQWYQKYDLLAKEWKKRPDDYIALELELVAHLLALEDREESLAEAAQFLDEHLLRWVKPFAMEVSARCNSRFYAGVAMLTAAYLEEVRDLLANILQVPRPSAVEIEKRMQNLNRPVGMVCAPVPELVAEEAERAAKLAEMERKG
jgi:TorA maturation chaperone TorD